MATWQEKINQLSNDLDAAFEGMRNLSGQLETIQNRLQDEVHASAAPETAAKADKPAGQTYKHTGWVHDRSKGELYKVRVRMGNKHICYQSTAEAADELARHINDAIEYVLSVTQ
jgi:hypothetical protein